MGGRSGTRPSRRVLRAACCALAAASLVSACGGESGSASSAATTVATPAAGATETGGGEPTQSPPAYEIDANATTADGRMSYTLPSGEAPAGTVTVTLQNNDTMMPHQAQLMKLRPGVTVEQFTTAINGPGGVGAVVPLADFAGGPNAVMPGEESSVTVRLDPGATYMVICRLPGPGGEPHYARGMIGHFTTAATAGTVDRPATEATVTMSDFRFAEPSSIVWTAPITVVDDGDQPHEMAVLAPAPGRTMEDVRAALAAPEAVAGSGPPVYEWFGGVAAAAPGQKQQTTLDLEPGDYLLVCFVVDPATGKPHYMLGMEQPVTVH